MTDVGVIFLAGKLSAAGKAKSMTLYRGVNESPSGYADALEGNAFPKGGNSTPLEHNTVTTESPYTSWTTNPEVAKNFALRPRGSGILLETSVKESSTIKSPNLKEVNLKQSQGTVVSESEVY